MNKVFLIFTLACTLLIGCNTTNEPVIVSTTELKVYSAFLQQYEAIRKLNRNGRQIVTFVRDTTIDPPPANSEHLFDTSDIRQSSGSEVQPIDVFTLFARQNPKSNWIKIKMSFYNANKYQARIECNAQLFDSSVKLISATDYHKMVKDILSKHDSMSESDKLNKYYGYELSRIGFDSLETVAVLYFNYSNPLGAQHGYALLKKENNTWVLLKRAFKNSFM